MIRFAPGVIAMMLFALIPCLVAAQSDEAAGKVTVKPADNGKALINPDMGWTMHFYSNVPANYGSQLEPSNTLDWFPGCSTVYLRIPWAFVEPEEGKYNWAILDTPAQRWISKGRRVAFRITTSENWVRFATPEWVKNAGAKGTFYHFGQGPAKDGTMWDPDFGDPIYLKKLENFMKAFGARYDNNPNVAFVDVGTYGLWGEGHTHVSSQVPMDKADPIVRKHIDLHRKYFPNTLLGISDDVIGHDVRGDKFPLTDYALSKDVTLRDDSILVQPPPIMWYHSELAQSFWPKLPVILEHEHYAGSKARKAWSGSLLIKSIEDYHASYMSIHYWPEALLEENRETIDKINRRMGYRIRLTKITWPEKVKIGQRFTVESTWGNAGVAPCYPGGFPALTLKDDKGGIVSVLVDETFNMRDLAVGAPDQMPVKSHKAEFAIGVIAPTTKPGTYDVYVSVGKRDGTPVIALPIDGDDGGRRYKLGKITLEQN